MTFGEAGTGGARVHDLKDVEAILDVFQSHGHSEVSNYFLTPLHQGSIMPFRLTLPAFTAGARVKSISERLTGRKEGSSLKQSSTPSRYVGPTSPLLFLLMGEKSPRQKRMQVLPTHPRYISPSSAVLFHGVHVVVGSSKASLDFSQGIEC